MELPAFAAPRATPGTASRVAGVRGTRNYSRHCKGSCRPLRHRPGATPRTAQGVAGLRGTGNYSRTRRGRCRPSRHRELLPAPQREMPALAAPGTSPGTDRQLMAFAAPGAIPGTANALANLRGSGSFCRHRSDSAKSLAGLRGTGNTPGTAVLGISGQYLNTRCLQSSTHLQSHLNTGVCLCCSVSTSS